MLAPLAGRIYDHAPQQNAVPLADPTDVVRMPSVVVIGLFAFSVHAEGQLAASEPLPRGCYQVAVVGTAPRDLSYRWPSSFELSDSGRVLPRADSISANAFWSGHQMARRWSNATQGTTIVFSTGEILTQITLRTVADSVFGTAEFPTDMIGPPVPRAQVVGRRVSCT